MKRRTLFAAALSGILLRASEVLGIEETKILEPKDPSHTIDFAKSFRAYHPQCRIMFDSEGLAETPFSYEYRAVSRDGMVLLEGEEARQYVEEAASGRTAIARGDVSDLRAWMDITFA